MTSQTTWCHPQAARRMGTTPGCRLGSGCTVSHRSFPLSTDFSLAIDVAILKVHSHLVLVVVLANSESGIVDFIHGTLANTSTNMKSEATSSCTILLYNTILASDSDLHLNCIVEYGELRVF